MNQIETYMEWLEMVDATNFTGTGEWLGAEDLKGSTQTLEITEVIVVNFDNDQGKDSKLGLMFKGKDKGIIANKTNTKRLIETLGTGDTDKWVGRSITAAPNPTPLGLGFSLSAVADDLDDDIPF